MEAGEKDGGFEVEGLHREDQAEVEEGGLVLLLRARNRPVVLDGLYERPPCFPQLDRMAGRTLLDED